MKQFLNVLYRRILYKIPLKFLLVLLALFAVCFASFSNAWLELVNQTNYTNIVSDWEYHSSHDLLCLNNITCLNNSNLRFNFNRWNWYYTYTRLNLNNYWQWMWVCTTWWSIYMTTDSSCNFTIDEYDFVNYTSLQCQLAYSLIPISSVDQSYCVNNNLCPSCPECETCSNFSGTVSNVYINGINHLWAPNIVMNIAEEIDWDYAYTVSWQNMNIDVVWYNVDYEKMQSVIDLQNYKPTDEDFSSLISMLAPYTKIIIFFVFLFLIWAWIKKPFRSKKL